MKPLSRESDERILDWLFARCNGQTPYAIAKAWGANRGAVSKATNDIRSADIAESGEPEGAVRAGYW